MLSAFRLRLLVAFALVLAASAASKPAPTITPAPPPGPSPFCVSTTSAPIVIRPCMGAPFKIVDVLPQKTLTVKPATLVFRPLFKYLGPLQVKITIFEKKTGFYITAPKELCTYGSEWNVLALDANGKLMGFEGEAGHFKMDCTPGASASPAPIITAAPPPGPGLNCVSTTGALVNIRPCTGVPKMPIHLLPATLLHVKPAKVIFRPLFAVLGPTQVIAKVNDQPDGFVVPAPVELCRLGPPGPAFATPPPVSTYNWNVIAFDTNDKLMGFNGEAGHFKITCTATDLATPPAPLPPGCGESAPHLVKADPCAGPPGTKVAVSTASSIKLKPALMIFHPVKGPPDFRIKLGGKPPSATTVAAMCKVGPKFKMIVVDAAGIPLAPDAGIFTIVCTSGGGPPPTPPPTASPSPSPSPKPKKTATPKPNVVQTPAHNVAPTPPPPCPPPMQGISFNPCFVSARGTLVTIQRVPSAPLPSQALAFQPDLPGPPVIVSVTGAPNFTFVVQAQLCRGKLVHWVAFKTDAGLHPVQAYAGLITNC